MTPRAVDKRARPGNVGSAVAADPPADLGKVGAPAKPPEVTEEEQPVPTATTEPAK